jgi:transposase
MTHSLSIDTQMDMKALLIKGTTPYSVIEKRFGVSAGVVSKYNKRWFPDGQRATGGRPAIVDDTSKALVRRKILFGRLLTVQDAYKEFLSLGYHLSYKTATNILRSMGFPCRNKEKEAIHQP